MSRTTATHPNARLVMAWANVQKALSTAARSNRGAGIVVIRVLFDECGEPLKWTRPEVTGLLPCKGGAGRGTLIEQVLEVLGS